MYKLKQATQIVKPSIDEGPSFQQVLMQEPSSSHIESLQMVFQNHGTNHSPVKLSENSRFQNHSKSVSEITEYYEEGLNVRTQSYNVSPQESLNKKPVIVLDDQLVEFIQYLDDKKIEVSSFDQKRQKLTFEDMTCIDSTLSSEIELPPIEQKVSQNSNLREFCSSIMLNQAILPNLYEQRFKDKNVLEIRENDDFNSKQLQLSLQILFQQRIRQMQNKKLRRMDILSSFTRQEDSQRIYTVNDMNMKYCCIPQNSETFMERQRLIYAKSEDLFHISVQRKIMNSVQLKIDAHIYRREDKLLNLSKFQFRNLDLEVLYKMKEDPGEANQRLKKFKSERCQKHFIIEQEMKHFENYATYIDLVWRNKNNKLAFIILNGNTEQIDNYQVPISIFDLKTKTNVLKIYNQFDWRAVDVSQRKFEISILKRLNFSESQLRKLNKVINQHIVECRILALERNTVKQRQLNIQVPKMCMQNLQFKFKEIIRVLPIIIKYKIALCIKNVQNYINDSIFMDRYSKILKVVNFREIFCRKQNQISYLQHKLDNKKLPISFKDTLTYHMVCNQDYINFNNIVFKHNHCSLYKRLYNPEFDFQLHMVIDYLYMKLKNAFMAQYLNVLESKKQTHVKVVPAKKVIERCKSCPTMITQMKLHAIRNHHLIPEEFFQRKERVIHTYREVEKGQLTDLVRPIERQDALDRYNSDFCKFVIDEKLQSQATKVKDSIVMFYKLLEDIIDEDDQDYNMLCRTFAYKSQYTRNPKAKQYIMEVYMPILKTKGELKLKKMVRNIRHSKKRQLKKQITMSLQKSIELMAEKEKLNKVSNENKILKAVQVDDFNTDESLKDIAFSDIKSDCSDDADDFNKRKKENAVIQSTQRKNDMTYETEKSTLAKAKFNKIQRDTKHPLEHYAQIRKEREKKEKAELENMNSAQRFIRQMEKQKKQPQIFQVVGENDLEDNQVQSQAVIQKNREKIETNISDVNDTFAIDCINALQSLRVRKKKYYELKSRNIKRNGGDFESFSKTVEGKVINQEILKINKQIDEIIKQVKQTKGNKSSAMTIANKKLKIITDIKSKLNNTMSKKIKLKKTTTKNAKKLYVVDEELIEHSEKGSDESHSLGKFSSEEEGESSLEFINAKKYATQKTNNYRDNVDGAIGLELLIKQEQLDILEQKESQYSVVQKRLDQMIDEIQNTKTLVNASSIDLLEYENLDYEKEYESDIDLNNEIKAIGKIRSQKVEKRKQKAIKNERRDKLFQNLKKVKRGPRKFENKHQQKETQNMKVAQIIKTKLFKNQRFEEDGFINDEFDGENPWKPYIGLKQLSSVDIESMQDEKNEKRISIQSLKSIERDQETYTAEFSEKLKEMLFEAIKNHNSSKMEEIMRRYQIDSENFLDKKGNSLVAMAAAEGDELMVKLLLSMGENPSRQNIHGNTALHYAVAGNYHLCVDTLIAFGIDENVENNEGLTAWELSSALI